MQTFKERYYFNESFSSCIQLLGMVNDVFSLIHELLLHQSISQSWLGEIRLYIGIKIKYCGCGPDLCWSYVGFDCDNLKDKFFRVMCLALKGAVVWKTTWDSYPLSTQCHQKNNLNQIRRRFPRIRRKAHAEDQQRSRLCCRRSRSTCCEHLRWQPASVAGCSGKPGCWFFLPSCSAFELRQDGGSAEQSGCRPS